MSTEINNFNLKYSISSKKDVSLSQVVFQTSLDVCSVVILSNADIMNMIMRSQLGLDEML